MIVYNITMKVDPAIEAEWVQWQQQEHIADIMASGCFLEYRFYRLLDQDQEEEPTYVIQYFAETREQYDRYLDMIAPALRKKALDRWGDHFITFRTVMESVH